MAYQGARGDGSGDDSGALQSAIDDAFSRNDGSMPQLTGACPNNHNVTVDLGGRVYQVQNKINIPRGGAVHITGGVIRCGGSFPVGEPIFNWPGAALQTHTLRFDWLHLDGNGRGNGMLISGMGLRNIVEHCHLSRFVDYGIKTIQTNNMVEATIKHNYFEEHLEGDATTPTGVGLSLEGGTDIEVHGNSAVRCGIGFYLGSEAGGQTMIANGARDCPIGMFLTTNIGSTVLNGGIFINSPIIQERAFSWNDFAIFNVIFAQENGFTGDVLVYRLKASTSSGNKLRDIVVRGCQFYADSSRSARPIQIDSNGFSWSAEHLDGMVIDENTFKNFPPVYSRITRRQAFSSSGSGDTEQISFGSELMGEPRFFSLACDSGSSIGVTGSRSGKTITARFDASGSGDLMIMVDSGNQPGTLS
jgi:hypothetical protein